MVRAEAPVWDGHEWHCRVAVRAGVYQRTDYPVTITYLGPVVDGEEGAAVIEAIGRLIEAVVEAHLWKGSLAPAGMLVNWRQQQEGGFGGDGLEPVRDLAARVDARVGRMSHADGHGYYHARDRRRSEGLSAESKVPASGPAPAEAALGDEHAAGTGAKRASA